MRSRKGWMSKNRQCWGDMDSAQTHWDNCGGNMPIPVQITELEEGCPEEYIQPGEMALDEDGERVTVLSQPFVDSFAPTDKFVQAVRDSDEYVYCERTDRLKRIPATKTYTVTVEAESPEDAVRKIVAEPQLLTESDEG